MNNKGYMYEKAYNVIMPCVERVQNLQFLGHKLRHLQLNVMGHLHNIRPDYSRYTCLDKNNLMYFFYTLHSYHEI